MRSERARYWQRIFVGNLIASAIVLFVFSGATWRTPPGEMARAFGIALLFSTCIGPLVAAVMPNIAPYIWRRTIFPLNWLAVSVAMVGLAMIGSVVAIGVLVVSGMVPASQFGSWFRGSLRISIAVTLTIGLFITAYEVMRARVAEATAQAQLASLESRVQPHFLFNTLNSIAALIHEDPHGAERMTGQLASLLRTSLDQQAIPLVPLGDELQTVRDYLAIEHVRFGDRLRYTIDVDPAALAARVPRLGIQTLVENSIKHAVSPRREGASIRIAATSGVNGPTRIVVEDDGPGFDAATLPAGHGLALLRDRAGLLFRDRGSLTIESAIGGTRVTLVAPHFHDKPTITSHMVKVTSYKASCSE
jgi:signal transduction histidine kinase